MTCGESHLHVDSGTWAGQEPGAQQTDDGKLQQTRLKGGADAAAVHPVRKGTANDRETSREASSTE